MPAQAKRGYDEYNLEEQKGRRIMQMGGEQRIDAPREVVWAALNDPDILRQCIPGCESVNWVSDTEMHAVATAMLGQVQARFKSRVMLSALDSSGSYRIAGESHGGSAGFARGGADVRPEAVGAASTLLKYDIDATVDGKLAQLGGRPIDQTAQKMVNNFFASLNEALARPAPVTVVDAATEPQVHAPTQAASPGLWLAVILALITLVLYLMALM